MEQPSWVSEGSIRKYNRAVAELTKEKKEVTEEAVKELYVKWGGLVIGDATTLVGVDEDSPITKAHEEEGATPPKAKKGAKK